MYSTAFELVFTRVRPRALVRVHAHLSLSLGVCVGAGCVCVYEGAELGGKWRRRRRSQGELCRALQWLVGAEVLLSEDWLCNVPFHSLAERSCMFVHQLTIKTDREQEPCARIARNLWLMGCVYQP